MANGKGPRPFKPNSFLIFKLEMWVPEITD